MDRTNALVGGVVVLAAVGAAIGIVPTQIPRGFAGMLSPRLVPVLALTGIALLGLVIVVQALRRPPVSPVRLSRTEWIGFVAIPALLLLALWLLPLVGPVVAGAGVVIGAALVMGERNPLMLLAQASGLLAVGYVLLVLVLGTTVG